MIRTKYHTSRTEQTDGRNNKVNLCRRQAWMAGQEKQTSELSKREKRILSKGRVIPSDAEEKPQRKGRGSGRGSTGGNRRKQTPTPPPPTKTKKRGQDAAPATPVAKQQESATEVVWCKQTRSHAVIVQTGEKINPDFEQYGMAVEELLKQIVQTTSDKKFKKPRRPHAVKIWKALKTGENPLPYLEVPNDKRQLKVLATPDISGSCQNFSHLSQGFALVLAKMEDVAVTYIENYNGQLIGIEWTKEKSAQFCSAQDIVFYLGDDDCVENALIAAEKGATFIAFSSYRANAGVGATHTPAKDISTQKGGRFLLYHYCNVNYLDTIVSALTDAVSRL